jgi:glycogen operon protein
LISDGANCLCRTKSGELVSDHSLPPVEFGPLFEPTLDSGTPDGTPVDQTPLPSGSQIRLSGRTPLLLRVPRSTK